MGKGKKEKLEIELIDSQQVEIKNIDEVSRYLPIFKTLENQEWQPGERFYDDFSEIVAKYPKDGTITHLRITMVKLPVEIIPERVNVD